MLTLSKSLTKLTLKALCLLCFRVRVTRIKDADDLSARPLLVIANHQSFLDGILLGLFLPLKDPVFIIHTSFVRKPIIRLFLSLVDYLPVDPTKPMAMKRVIRLLQSGRPVVIFPEGRITLTGSLMKVYDGTAFVAVKTKATILPVRLEGATRSYFSRLYHRPRKFFPKITMTIMPQTSIAVSEESSHTEQRRKAGEKMRRLMQEAAFAAHPCKTLYSRLCDTIDLHGKNRRLIEDMKLVEYSYQDFLKTTLMLARLVGKITHEHERVGLLLPNMMPSVALFIGLTGIARVPAMINYTAGVAGMQAAIQATQIKTIITSRTFVEQAKLGDKLSAFEDVRMVYLEDIRDSISFTDKLWLLWRLKLNPRRFEIPTSPESPAVILFTSGSENKPKGVVLSHRAILSNIAQILSVIDISMDDKILNVLPIFHSFGLTVGALLPIYVGAGLFLYPSPLHYRVIPELAYDRGCTALFGTSTFLASYAKHAHPYDFYRLRYAVAGAERLSSVVRDTWFEKFGIRILEGYGATETAPVLAVNTPMAFKSGTVGQFLPGVSYRLEPVPGINSGGLLHVKGANVMSGYYKIDRPGELQKTASCFGEGWYETGDIVEVDHDGFVKILGRLKRFAKIAGEMISLESAEKIAREASPAASHAVISKMDEAKGETLILFTTDPTLTREQLRAAVKSLGLPEMATPKIIVPISALPLLGSGKTDYVSLQLRAETL